MKQENVIFFTVNNVATYGALLFLNNNQIYYTITTS